MISEYILGAYYSLVIVWSEMTHPLIDESLAVCLDIMLPFAIFTLQS